ncbi:hypothetical protein ACFVUS_29875 [Nocardia sp. NPDC058058]|uniref:nSTAND1 domain-containing NTPase n=1 Tax=Nocardia sp. NPDC058058 TaxID=3346317 RepID=UPI0036DD87CA
MVAGGRDHFAERLTRLFALAGNPVLKSVVRRANSRSAPGAPKVTGQRISDWRRGNTVPSSFEAVLPVLAVLIDTALEQPRSNNADPRLFDLIRWRELWTRAKQDSAQTAPRVREFGYPPYRGLSPYRIEDADLFFGREIAHASVLRAIDAAEFGTGDPRIVLIVGVSGAGKSSLLSAGLQANSGGRATLRVAVGERPDIALRAAAGRMRGDSDVLLLIDQAEELFTLCRDVAIRRAFLDDLRSLTLPRPGGRRVTAVLAFRSDFFTDLIGYEPLATAMRKSSVIVGAMTEPELREVITRPAQACGLTVEPALVDVVLHDLTAATSEDGGAALLPLLSHVLEVTWQRRRGRTLTLEAYRDAGGLAGSVAAAAERAWTALSPAERDSARGILMALTVIGPHSVTRNRVAMSVLVLESADPQATTSVVARLTDARLVIVHDEQVELLHEAVLHAWPRMAEWIEAEKEFGPTRHRIEEDARSWYAQGKPREMLYDRKRLEVVDTVAGDTDSINPRARLFVAESVRNQRRSASRRRTGWIIAAVLCTMTLLAASIAVAERHATSHERIAAQVTRLIQESQRVENFDPVASTRMALAAYRMRPDSVDTQARLLSTQAAPIVTASAERHAGPITELAYDPNKRVIASAGKDALVRLWSLDDAGIPREIGDGLHGHRRSVMDLLFVPGSDVLVSAGYDGSIRFWDVRDPRQVGALGVIETPFPVLALAYSRAGRSIVAGGADGQLTLVDAADAAAPRLLRRVPAHSDSVESLTTDPAGTRLVSGADDHTIRVWDMAEPGTMTPIGAPLATTGAVTALAWGPDDRVAAGTGEGAVGMWSLADPADPRGLGLPRTVHQGAVTALIFSPNGEMASGSTDGMICLWRLTPSEFYPSSQPVGGNRGAINGLRLIGADRVISGGDDGRVRVWSRASADVPVATSSPFTSAELSASGSRLVTSGKDGRFQTWSVGPAEVRMTADVQVATQPFSGVVADIRPDGQVVSISDMKGGNFRLWSLADPSAPVPLSAPISTRTRYFTEAGFTSDGKILVTGDTDIAIQLWDVSAPENPRRLGSGTVEGSRVFRSLAISADGRLAAVGSMDGTIYLWDIADRDKPHVQARLTGHLGPVATLSFGADGRYLYSGGQDESIRTWDVAAAVAGRPAAAGVIRTPSVTNMALDRTGRRLVTAGVDQSVRLWTLGDPAHPRPLGGSISTAGSSNWFVHFDNSDGSRVLGVSDMAAERWSTDPERVAAMLCRTPLTYPGNDSPLEASVLDSSVDLCPK